MPMQTADMEAQVSSDKSKTITFTVHDEKEDEMKRTLSAIYEALREKGYNPINQLVGYILRRILLILRTIRTPAASSAALTAMSC